jgi:KDO2-lipid IV(A) lauroyltransferase
MSNVRRVNLKGIRRVVKARRNDLFYLLALSARTLARTLPRPLGLPLFGALTAFAYRMPSVDKTRTLDHLSLIYGERWSEATIEATARGVYANIGMNMFDAICLPGLDEQRLDAIVKIDARNEFDQAYHEGNGIVVITAHCGCFEMLLPLFARKGYRCFALGQRLFDKRIDKLVSAARNGPNMESLYRSDNPREIIRRLREGKVFGVLIDQDTRVEGLFAPFLGKLAYTPSGPLKIALRYKVPVFVVTTARQPDNTHRVFISPRLTLQHSDDFQSDLLHAVQEANAHICRTIEAYPQQWVWMHRRWSRTPASGGSESLLLSETLEHNQSSHPHSRVC